MSKTELLPCPHCNAPGVLTEMRGEFGPQYHVVCSRSCELNRIVGTPFVAVEKWNRRDSSRLDALRAGLEAAYMYRDRLPSSVVADIRALLEQRT